MPEGSVSIKTRLTGPALGLLAVGLVLLFAFGTELTSELYRQIELRTLDVRFRSRPELEQSPLILHVDIDDTTVHSFGRFNSWSRTRHATLVRLLKELGADAVVFDVEFTEVSNEADDAALAEALAETAFCYLPFRLDLKPQLTDNEVRLEARIRERVLVDFQTDELDLAAELDIPLKSARDRLPGIKQSIARSIGWDMLQQDETLTAKRLFDRLIPKRNPDIDVTQDEKIIAAASDHALARRLTYQRSAKPLASESDKRYFVSGDVIEPPIHDFTVHCIGLGASNTRPDPEDGVIRYVSLFFVESGRALPHLSVSAACRAVGADVKDVDVVPGSHVTIYPKNDASGNTDPIVIPVDDRCRAIINWAGNRATTWDRIFRHIPYGSILDLDEIRKSIAYNDKTLVSAYRKWDAGPWAEAETAIKTLERKGALSDEEKTELDRLRTVKRQNEERIYNYLKRKAPKNMQEAQALPPDIRETARQMVYCRDVIETQINAIRNEKDLRQSLEEVVRGRLCLVGSTETASTDLKPTPIHSRFPGVGVHSALINSVLQRSFVQGASEWLNIAIIVLAGLVVSLLANHLSTRWAAVASLVVLIGWVLTAYLLFLLAGLWVAVAGPVITGFLSYAAITAYRQLTEERQKRHIRNAFQHYLSPSVVSEVLKNPDALKLGGERKELTVFFSDVAGFTPISEQLEPEELVQLLNDYLSEMSDVILDSNGYINKYEGDAIMAVFGAPLADKNHAAAACRVALESQRRLKDFRAKLIREKRPIIRARIGINSGIMVVGNMGSHKLFDYTVMGDNVNIGARLENASKHFGTEVIIGENTYNMVHDTFEARRLGMVSVKGRTRPVGAYELLAEKGKCPPMIAKILPNYGEGLAAYAEQRWDEAVAAFNACLKINPKDGPSRAYLNRCSLLSSKTDEEHWDGTFTLEM